MNIEELNKVASENANALAQQQERASERLDAYVRWSENARGLLNLADQARKERRFVLAELLDQAVVAIVTGGVLTQEPEPEKAPTPGTSAIPRGQINHHSLAGWGPNERATQAKSGSDYHETLR